MINSQQTLSAQSMNHLHCHRNHTRHVQQQQEATSSTKSLWPGPGPGLFHDVPSSSNQRVTYTSIEEKDSNHGYVQNLILQRGFRWSCLISLYIYISSSDAGSKGDNKSCRRSTKMERVHCKTTMWWCFSGNNLLDIFKEKWSTHIHFWSFLVLFTFYRCCCSC